ncbi:uncharacterized protein LOC141532240 [Cotesia typhae]|uniref:uncharacterized protein LOC141532240 n=1 Tax=Cotesia typhae TaxID=2053667 RepID=UPI003D692A1B
MKPELTMEEEIWLMEEMLERPLQLLLTPSTSTTTTTSTPTTQKKPNIRIRENRPVRTRIHWPRRPYDRTKPGLSKSLKRPLIRPASAEMIVGIRKATRPGPPTTGGPRLVAKAHNSPKPTVTRRPSDAEASHTLTDEPSVPTEAAASFVKTKRRIGRWRGAETIINPGPLPKSGPQPKISPKRTSNSGPLTKSGPQLKVTPEEISKDSLQLKDVPINDDAAWLTYDDAPLVEEYPTEFKRQAGELFSAPAKVQIPLEKILATLTRLEEVREEHVTKRRQFTAYDRDMKIYRVTRTTKTPTPWIKTLGKTVQQLLEKHT